MDPDEVFCLQRLRSPLPGRQFIEPRGGDEESAVWQGHLSVFQQVVDGGKDVSLRLLHAIQEQNTAVEGSTHGSRVVVQHLNDAYENM